MASDASARVADQKGQPDVWRTRHRLAHILAIAWPRSYRQFLIGEAGTNEVISPTSRPVFFCFFFHEKVSPLWKFHLPTYQHLLCGK